MSRMGKPAGSRSACIWRNAACRKASTDGASSCSRRPRTLKDHIQSHHWSSVAKWMSRCSTCPVTSTKPASTSSCSRSSRRSKGREMARRDTSRSARRSSSQSHRSSSPVHEDTATTPPGTSTRRNSAVARVGRGKKNSPKEHRTKSNESSSNSRCSASITWSSVVAARSARARASPAVRIISGDRSTPTTRPPAPALTAAGSNTAPRPHATSRTRAPGWMPAVSAKRAPKWSW